MGWDGVMGAEVGHNSSFRLTCRQTELAVRPVIIVSNELTNPGHSSTPGLQANGTKFHFLPDVKMTGLRTATTTPSHLRTGVTGCWKD